MKSIAERMAKLGCEVVVFSGISELDIPYKETVNGIKVIRWPTYSPSEAYHLPKLRKEFIKALISEMQNSDVIHLHI